MAGVFRRGMALAAGAAAALWLAIVPPSVAWASNWIRKTGDNAAIRFDLCDLNAGFHTAWHDNNGHDIDPTDIVPSHVHSCDTVEVRMNDYAYGDDDPIGWWECHSVAILGYCLNGHVHINLTKTGSLSAGERLSLTCQEIGHSVGLAHPTSGTSCMIQTISADRQHLLQHDIDLLNSNY